MEPRKAGRGCSYCSVHAIAARKEVRRKKRNNERKKSRPTKRPIEIIHVECEPAHQLALRMLAGKV